MAVDPVLLVRKELRKWISETGERGMYSATEVRDRLLDLLLAVREDEMRIRLDAAMEGEG